MFIWSIITGISHGIINLAEFIAYMIWKGVFGLFKLWFDYLVAFVSSGSELSFIGVGFLIFTTIGFLVGAYYIFKYIGIWVLIVAPIVLIFLKLIILIIMGIIAFVGINALADKIKRKGGKNYVSSK